MKPGHALAHRSGHRHKNSKGGHGRGVQRDGRGGKGRPGGGGRGQGGGPRGVCLRVPAAPPRSAAASDLREGGRRASRAVAGAGWGATPEYHLGGRGQGRQGAGGALRAPIDRREEMPTRKVASATGAPVPARAATRRRRAGASARSAARATAHQRLCACEATCAKRAWLTRWGKTCAKHPSPGITRRPSPPPPPAASARARAGGPRRLRAARWRRPTR